MQRNVFSQFDCCNDIVGAISIWLAKTLEWIGGQLTWNLCRINLSKYVMAGWPEKIGKHGCVVPSSGKCRNIWGMSAYVRANIGQCCRVEGRTENVCHVVMFGMRF